MKTSFSLKMNTQELKVNYKKLLNKAAKANGRKETVSYLNRAAKIKSKIYSSNINFLLKIKKIVLLH